VDLNSRAGGGQFRASAGHEPIIGVWGLCPQWDPGAKPLVGGSGFRGAKPPEADEILANKTVSLL